MSINKKEERELEELASEFLSGPLEEEEETPVNDANEENHFKSSEMEESFVAEENNQEEECAINFTKIALDFAFETREVHYALHNFLLPCESYRVYTEDGPLYEKCVCFLLVVTILIYSEGK